MAKYHSRPVGALSVLDTLNYLLPLSCPLPSLFLPSLFNPVSDQLGPSIVHDVSACLFNFPLWAQSSAAVCVHVNTGVRFHQYAAYLFQALLCTFAQQELQLHQ